MEQETTSLSQVYLLIEQDRFPEAIVLLENSLDTNTQNKEALYWLSYCFIQINHPIAAIEALSSYTSDVKKEEHIEAALLIAHFDAVHFTKAEEIASYGIEAFPLCPHFWRYKGFITARETPQESAPFFEKAFALSPKEYPLPKPRPEHDIIQQIMPWLPKDAQEWLKETTIKISLSPSMAILTGERFPNHPLSPFLFYEETLHVFLQNLCYLPTNQSAKSTLFEQLLALWNHLR